MYVLTAPSSVSAFRLEPKNVTSFIWCCRHVFPKACADGLIFSLVYKTRVELVGIGVFYILPGMLGTFLSIFLMDMVSKLPSTN